MTTTEANDLLRMLGNGGVGTASSIRGAGAHAGGRTGASSIEDSTFADLFKKAADGDVSSGLPVTVDPDAGVNLNDEQLAALAVAADRAEAAGIRKAVVFTGESAILLDVGSRTVIGKADMSGGVVGGVDGVVRMNKGSVTDAAPLLGTPPSFVGSNPSLTQLLASRESSASD